MKKILSILLLAAMLLSLIVPVSAAETLEERQRAIAEVAAAFHYKGSIMQYDSTGLNYEAIRRSHNYVTPEDATTQHEIYTVCSSFVFEVLYNAFGYEMAEHPDYCYTENLYNNSFGHIPEDMYVLRFSRDEQGADKQREYVDMAMELLQTGDIIVTVAPNGFGHALVYCDDVDYDGSPNVIDSNGSKYSMTDRLDAVEPNGNIILRDKQELVDNQWLTMLASHGFVILRPLQSEALKDYAITPATKARMQYPHMVIDRTADCGFYGSVATDELVTYTITISNFSNKPYENLKVTETVPAGTSLSLVDGQPAAATQKNLSWTLDIPVGESRTVSYSVKVGTPRGGVVISGGGSVGGVPSNTLVNTVSGEKPSATVIRNFVPYLRAANTTPTRSGAEMVEKLYEQALGAELDIPTAAELIGGCFTKKKIENTDCYALAENPTANSVAAYDMLVDGYLGGYYVLTETSHDRLLQLDAADMEPGDILVTSSLPATNDSGVYYFYTGQRLLTLNEDGKIVSLRPSLVMNTLLAENFFVLLRPSQAYDSLITNNFDDAVTAEAAE